MSENNTEEDRDDDGDGGDAVDGGDNDDDYDNLGDGGGNFLKWLHTGVSESEPVKIWQSLAWWKSRREVRSGKSIMIIIIVIVIIIIVVVVINIIISITTCLQTSRSSTVWSNCPGIQEAHESVAKAEEDGLRLPGHDKTEDDCNAEENDHNQ